MAKNKLPRISVVVAGAIVIASAWTYMNYRIERSRRENWAGVDIVGWNITRNYTERANLALASTFQKLNRPSMPEGQWRDIILYYFSEDDLLKNLKWSGVEVRSIMTQSMTFASDPPYKGYMVTLNGQTTDQAPPKVWLGDKSVEVEPMKGFNEIWHSSPDAIQRFDHNREMGERVEEVPKTTFGRAFLPSPNELAKGVRLSPPPVFEKDYFLKGKWVGSFAVWNSEAELKSAKLEKFG